MTNPLAEAPETIRSILTAEIDDAWSRGSPERRAPTAEDAEQRIYKSIEYSLRMSWLGRTDKIGRTVLPALAWATQTFVPPDVQTRNQTSGRGGAAPGAGDVQFRDENHVALADGVTRSLIECYRQLPGMDFPPSREAPSPGWMRRFFR